LSERHVVVEVAAAGRAPAARAGASGVADLRQVPQHHPRIMTLGLMPVVAVVDGDRAEGDDQLTPPGCPGGQPPRAEPAGWAAIVCAGEREPRSVGAAWGIGPARRPECLAAAVRPRAAVPDGDSALFGDGHAPGGPRAGCGGAGQVAGQPGVDRANSVPKSSAI
jgi:hypothetical protein